MTDDLRLIVGRLIAEHGLDGAVKVAMQMTATASDNFELSVWRDVKRLLRERKDEAWGSQAALAISIW